MARSSKSFGTAQAKKAHLVDGKGGIPGEIFDLRQDVEVAFQANESRTGFPELEWLDGAAPAAAGGTVVLRGSALLQSQTFDALVLVGTGTGVVTLTCLKPGDSGISVVVATPAGGSPAITLVGSVLTITPQTGGNTVAEIATAINVGGAATKGIVRAVSGGTGNISAAQASQPMTGGVGLYSGNTVTISGVECLPLHATGVAPAATWENTVISVTMPDMTTQTPARAAADNVVAKVRSNGICAGGSVSILLGS